MNTIPQFHHLLNSVQKKRQLLDQELSVVLRALLLLLRLLLLLLSLLPLLISMLFITNEHCRWIRHSVLSVNRKTGRESQFPRDASVGGWLGGLNRQSYSENTFHYGRNVHFVRKSGSDRGCRVLLTRESSSTFFVSSTPTLMASRRSSTPLPRLRVLVAVSPPLCARRLRSIFASGNSPILLV